MIGADHYWQVVEDHIIRGNGPTAMKSKLGYLLSGPLITEKQTEQFTANILNISTQPVREAELFWSVEYTAISPQQANPDKEFMAIYRRTNITRQLDGLETVLPTNFTMCDKRTKQIHH